MLAHSFEVLELEKQIVPAADDQRRQAIPFIDNLQINESGVLLQGLAANADGLGFALGLDDGGVGVNLRALLHVFGFGGFLFLDHLGLDGALQLFGESDVFDDDVFDYEQGANFLPGEFEGASLDLLAVLDDLLGALQSGDFFEGLLDARARRGCQRGRRCNPGTASPPKLSGMRNSTRRSIWICCKSEE